MGKWLLSLSVGVSHLKGHTGAPNLIGRSFLGLPGAALSPLWATAAAPRRRPELSAGGSGGSSARHQRYVITYQPFGQPAEWLSPRRPPSKPEIRANAGLAQRSPCGGAPLPTDTHPA